MGIWAGTSHCLPPARDAGTGDICILGSLHCEVAVACSLAEATHPEPEPTARHQNFRSNDTFLLLVSVPREPQHRGLIWERLKVCVSPDRC